MSDPVTGAIRGSVTDTQGEDLPGVTVTLKGLSNSQPTKVVVSDAEGQFRFLGLPPGQYEVIAQMAGFSPFDDRDVYVRIDQTTQVRVVLSPNHME
ncbi:MAG: carboxypeptidase regulatory-like domain-containing protein [Xanthomonadales bacterium]|nr:carboxypeptidase regulatory-like domain-containing protein [Xanthomonadales bacterium]